MSKRESIVLSGREFVFADAICQAYFQEKASIEAQIASANKALQEANDLKTKLVSLSASGHKLLQTRIKELLGERMPDGATMIEAHAQGKAAIKLILEFEEAAAEVEVEPEPETEAEPVFSETAAQDLPF